MNYLSNLPFLRSWLFESGIKIIAILIIAWIVVSISRFFVSRAVKVFFEKEGKKEILSQRIKTLTSVFSSTLRFVIWTVAILTILPECNINIAPLLAGAGLVGLAIGMGARNLIQDYFSGLFILLEDQYRVGEMIDVGGTKGKVVNLNLRRTTLKGDNGVIHTIPNGQIAKVSNFSRG